ncbi:MAG: NlpC/P60 family protein [Syntrophales bacterium]|nr:NlpC/P60 family protein [Syntrophales bacterium]
MGVRKRFICLAVAICFISSGCGHREKLYHASPVSLPGITDKMNAAGFWISRHPSPDKEILSPSGICALNAEMEALKITHRVINMRPVYSGELLRNDIRSHITSFYGRGLYLRDGRKAGLTFYREIEKTIGLAKIPETIDVGFGLLIRNADERIIPTEEGLYAKPGDLCFDEVQNSGLDIGAAVAVIYKSTDGLWTYVINDTDAGWVRSDRIVLSSLEDLRRHKDSSVPKVIVTARRADIFLDEALTEYYDHARMGTRLTPGGRETADIYEVTLPARAANGEYAPLKGYVRKKDVSSGYLAYTSRNIIDQAFRLLSAPYGWGDKGGGQDCSRFIQEIFATVGVLMPRNSGHQAKVGRIVGEYAPGGHTVEKTLALKKEGIGGVTILQLKGHIMLYLGEIDGNPYVIHSVWGYREPDLLEDRVRVIGRVAVTDASLGEGSQKGSLLERILTIRNVDKSNETSVNSGPEKSCTTGDGLRPDGWIHPPASQTETVRPAS